MPEARQALAWALLLWRHADPDLSEEARDKLRERVCEARAQLARAQRKAAGLPWRLT